jgi:hypothetical protein
LCGVTVDLPTEPALRDGKRLAVAALVTLFALLSAGCGASRAIGPAVTSPASSPTATNSVSSASSLADLRNRPFNAPGSAANGSCPTTASHDLSPVVSGAKGKGPGFGFGPGPVYLSGIVQLYPGAFDNEIWLIEPTYLGPVLIRGGQVNGTQAISFEEPTFFPDQGFSSKGSPPPGQPVATVTIAGSPIPFYQELDLPASTPADVLGKWRMFFARTHIDSPGCYAFQLDGFTFSVVIIIHVPDAARPGG